MRQTAARHHRDAWTGYLRQIAVGVRGYVSKAMRPLAAVVIRVGDGIGRRLPSGRVLAAVGAPLFFFGVASPLVWFVAARVFGPDLPRTEFPLGDVHDVAVDSQGRIYVADSFHNRIQRYSAAGEFQLAWHVPAGGVFALRTTTDDRIQVATARDHQLLTYHSDGGLLDRVERVKPSRYKEFATERETTGPYAVRWQLLPQVVDTRTGETVVATPWYVRLFAAPFPAMVYGLVGGALIALADRKRRRERAANTSPSGAT